MDITIFVSGAEIPADAWFSLIDSDPELAERGVMTCVNPITGKTLRMGSTVGIAFFQPDGKETLGAFAYQKGKIFCENANDRTAAKAEQIAKALHAELAMAE